MMVCRVQYFQNVPEQDLRPTHQKDIESQEAMLAFTRSAAAGASLHHSPSSKLIHKYKRRERVVEFLNCTRKIQEDGRLELEVSRTLSITNPSKYPVPVPLLRVLYTTQSLRKHGIYR